jgi:hypothetical protein
MINKYSGITLLLLAVIAIIFSWSLYKKQKRTFYINTSNTMESQQLIRDIKIKPEAFASLQVMKEVLSTVSSITNNDTQVNHDAVSIALSPKVNKSKRPILENPTKIEKQRRMAASICRQARKLKVSMSFVTSEEKYAVISDHFVREGQNIDNKFKIISISPDIIKVKKYGVMCKVKVNS